MKIKLFTDRDLDGVGCAVVAKVLFEGVDIEYCNYDNINAKVSDFINGPEFEKYSMIFITDISVNGDIADMLDSCDKQIYLLDHHSTAEWLNDYEWAFVTVEHDGKLQSGCNLFYEKLRTLNLIDLELNSVALAQFVETVRLYDTYDWTRIQGCESPKHLHDVLGIIGIGEFVFIYTDVIHCKMVGGSEFDIPPVHKNLLKYFKAKNDNYINERLEEVKVFVDSFGNKCAFVISSDFSTVSELGNKMCKEYSCDYAAICTGVAISLRSVGSFNVSEIAKFYGGGGRCNTAGMPAELSYLVKYTRA
jgi:uncharacterized protein